MIIDDVAFHLWEVKCDNCGIVKIFYKEDDMESYKELVDELIAQGWVLEVGGGGCYCKRCINERKSI